VGWWRWRWWWVFRVCVRCCTIKSGCWLVGAVGNGHRGRGDAVQPIYNPWSTHHITYTGVIIPMIKAYELDHQRRKMIVQRIEGARRKFSSTNTGGGRSPARPNARTSAYDLCDCRARVRFRARVRMKVRTRRARARVRMKMRTRARVGRRDVVRAPATSYRELDLGEVLYLHLQLADQIRQPFRGRPLA
jgi:hypothetical protein